MPSSSRRSLFRTVGAVASTLVAGCLGNQTDDEGTPNADETQTPTPDETDTPSDERLSITGPGPLPADEWPLPRRGVTNGGYVPFGVTVDEEPSRHWRVEPTIPSDIANGSYVPIYKQPVLSNGNVYAVNELTFGPQVALPDRHFLRAFDTETGDEIWEYEITIAARNGDGTPRPTRPAIGNGTVFVGAGTTVLALDVEDRTERWRHRFNASIAVDNLYPFDDRTFVARRFVEPAKQSVHVLDDSGETTATLDFEKPVRTIGSNGRYLYAGATDAVGALNLETGEDVWRWTFEDDESVSNPQSLLVVEGGLFMKGVSGDLHALSQTGDRIWHDTAGFDGVTTDGSLLYAGLSDGTLTAVDPETGERQWERNFGSGSGYSTSPAMTDDALYAATSDETLVAVRPSDGTELWVKRIDLEGLLLGSEGLYGVDGERALVALR